MYQGKPVFYSLGNFVFEGFPDKINNVGWALRMDVGKTGVLSWQLHTAQIDRQGISHATGWVINSP